MRTSVNDMISRLKINNKELDIKINSRRELLGCAKKDYCCLCTNGCKSELPIRNKKSKVLIINDFADDYKTYELIAKLSIALKYNYNDFSYISLMHNVPGIKKDDFLACSTLALTMELNTLKPDIVVGLGVCTTKMIQKVLNNDYKIKKSEETIIIPENIVNDYSFRYIETVSISDLINDFDNFKKILAQDLFKILQYRRKIA